MSNRPTLPDVALAALLLPVWAVAFFLHVERVVSGDLAWAWVTVERASVGAHPTVQWIRPDSRAAASGLLEGDTIIEVGDTNLRGAGPATFFAETLAAADSERRVPVRYAREGAEDLAVLELTPVAYPWRSIPITLAFVVTGVLVLFRRPGAALSRAFFVAAMLFSLHWTFFFGGKANITYAWLCVFFLSSTLMFPLMLRPLYLFLAQAEEEERGMPPWTWALAVFGPVSVGWVIGEPIPAEVAFRFVFALNVLWVGAFLAVLTAGYRRVGPQARRQLRWVVYGFYLGTVPVLATNAAITMMPELWWLHELAVAAEAAIPVCLFIGIVRSNLFDIDRLISATTAYSLVSVILIATFLTVVPRMAEAMSRVFEISPENAQLALSVLLAGCIVPGGRAIRPRIEEVFFAERHALQRGFDQLLVELEAATDAEHLLRLLGERLAQLLRPTWWSIYGSLEGGFGLVLAGTHPDGREAPGTLAGPRGSLVQGRGPIDIEAVRLASDGTRDQLADLVELERMGVAVLLPISRGSETSGVTCLGAKTSGDIYTSTDRTLLSAVTTKVSDILLRFDEAEILQKEREMRGSLARYVPASVANRLESGQEIEGGERILSVLFVDVRGYSTYSESRTAGTVFSTINLLTDMYSDVIRRKGGTVVEFLGDGVMAVFGAPDPLPHHARAALEAGIEICASVRELRLSAERRPDADIEVGVGISTGTAFVGNVETKDRLIFTAIGDTVNVASRLQSMTRSLGAAIAIDRTTFDEAPGAAQDFLHHGATPIRGRRETADVYFLPLTDGAPEHASRPEEM